MFLNMLSYVFCEIRVPHQTLSLRSLLFMLITWSGLTDLWIRTNFSTPWIPVPHQLTDFISATLRDTVDRIPPGFSSTHLLENVSCEISVLVIEQFNIKSSVLSSREQNWFHTASDGDRVQFSITHFSKWNLIPVGLGCINFYSIIILKFTENTGICYKMVSYE